MPGACWPPPPPGDQIAYIAEGVLTYTVEDGTRVMTGPATTARWCGSSDGDTAG